MIYAKILIFISHTDAIEHANWSFLILRIKCLSTLKYSRQFPQIFSQINPKKNIFSSLSIYFFNTNAFTSLFQLNIISFSSPFLIFLDENSEFMW